MSSTLAARTRTDITPGLGRTLTAGAVAGVIASLVMAMFAMIAAGTYQHTGFFTPLYHIASLLLDPSTMMTSMQQAMSGSSFYFAFGPAVVGAIIHMMTGAIYGIGFALLARAARLSGLSLTVTGMVYGTAIFAFSAWIGLPLAATLLGSGNQITNMAAMVGYPTFLLEHIMFGVAAAVVLLPVARRFTA